MPMGDSNTQGTLPGGYRLPLYNLLQNGGYTFDFVGNKSQANDPTPDTNHWGQSGWQISATPATIEGRSYVSIQGENRSGLYEEMSSAISTTYFSTDTNSTRNIILLQIGINDVLHQVVDSSKGSFNSDINNDGQGEGQEWVAEGNIERLQALLRHIDSLANSRDLQIEVILGTSGPLTTAWKGDAVSNVLINEVLQYNSLINSVIPSMVFSKISVKIVDQYGAMLGRLADGVHPNSAGYAAMAQEWFGAIGGSSATTSLQSEPRITGLANGRFVSTWKDVSGAAGDPSGSAIRAQLFHADGTRAGSEFLVNSTTAGNQDTPAAAALADGRFVITWSDDSRSGNDRSGTAIRAQLFNANGSRAGSELLVNSTTAGNQSNPSITALTAGRFAIAWTDDSRSGNDRSGTAIRAQLFNANGSRAGSEFLINSTTAGNQSNPSITALPDGRFVVTWTDDSRSGGDTSGSAIRAQVFNANGSRAGSELLVNSTTAGNQSNPFTTALPDGRFVVTWTDDSRSGGDTSGSAIRAQVFNANGSRAGSELLVNSTTAGNQSNPSITALPDGRFAIAWTDDSRSGGDTSGSAIRAQLFNANGSRAGSELLVNTNTVGSQYQPTITTLADGRFAVGWTDGNVIGRDPSNRAVQTRIFDPRTAGVNLAGTANGDDLIGTRFNDTLRGLAGDDHLRGGAGNDTLIGGAGADVLTGEGGIDRFVLNDGATADVITDFNSAIDKLVISQAGLRIGNGNTNVDGAQLRSSPGGFSTAAELVIFTTNIASATITTANAAASIGRAAAAYAVGATRLFAVDNGVRSHLYRFRAADANAIVAATELTLLADLRATPALALADLQFAL
jgi:lysophospholipase L1-like esterase